MNRSTYSTLLQQADKLHRHNKQGSYKTKERYFEAYKRFLHFVASEYHLQKIANTAPRHILAYVKMMQEKGLAASTIKTDLAAIRFWHDQIPQPRHSHLPENTELKLERRKFGGVDRTWSQGEYNRMIALCWKVGREDYAACNTIARHAGLRIHEVLRLDTAMARNALRIRILTIKGKGGKIRQVPVTRPVEIVFQEYLGKTKPGHKLFVLPGKDTHIAKAELQNFINRHRAEIQDIDNPVPLTFHGLRHTYALEQYKKYLAEGKSDLEAKKSVSINIGHNRPDVTRIYLAGLQGKKRSGGK